jgi:hypothetical protein
MKSNSLYRQAGMREAGAEAGIDPIDPHTWGFTRRRPSSESKSKKQRQRRRQPPPFKMEISSLTPAEYKIGESKLSRLYSLQYIFICGITEGGGTASPSFSWLELAPVCVLYHRTQRSCICGVYTEVRRRYSFLKQEKVVYWWRRQEVI